jgi:predicted MFS family arabinose efflux permease
LLAHALGPPVREPLDVCTGQAGSMRAVLALAVTLGAVLLVLHLIHNPTMENFLVGLWQQIHLTRQ